MDLFSELEQFNKLRQQWRDKANTQSSLSDSPVISTSIPAQPDQVHHLPARQSQQRLRQVANGGISSPRTTKDRLSHESHLTSEATKLFEATFPERWGLITTPGTDYMCAAHAVCLSWKAQHPHIEPPTPVQLVQALESPDFVTYQAGFGLTNTNDLYVDQIAAVLHRWAAARIDLPVQLGYVVHEKAPVSLKTDNDGYDTLTVWIHNDNSIERGLGSMNHFSDMRPLLASAPVTTARGTTKYPGSSASLHVDDAKLDSNNDLVMASDDHLQLVSSEPDPAMRKSGSSDSEPVVVSYTEPKGGPIATAFTDMLATFFFVRALFDFRPSEPGELEFWRGDIIVVIESVYQIWWKGWLRDQTGVFPTNYVEAWRDPALEELMDLIGQIF